MFDAAHACAQRRKKTAKERREQRLRSEGRLVGKLIESCAMLSGHRGCQPSRLLQALSSILASNVDEVAMSPSDVQADLPPRVASPSPPAAKDLDSLPDLIDLDEPLVDVIGASSSWVPLDSMASQTVKDVVNDDKDSFYAKCLQQARLHIEEHLFVLEAIARWARRGATIEGAIRTLATNLQRETIIRCPEGGLCMLDCTCDLHLLPCCACEAIRHGGSYIPTPAFLDINTEEWPG